ncbi:hypothetical protein ACT4UT_00260, partial [Bacillus sp. B-TM1]
TTIHFFFYIGYDLLAQKNLFKHRQYYGTFNSRVTTTVQHLKQMTDINTIIGEPIKILDRKSFVEIKFYNF